MAIRQAGGMEWDNMISITPYSGAAFWLITCVFILFFLVIQKFGSFLWVRNIFITATSTAVLFYTIDRPGILIPILFALCTIVYYAGKHLSNTKVTPNSNTLIVTIVSIVLFLCYFKYHLIQSSVNNLVGWSINNQLFFIGISYFSFKFIHFLLECQKKKIKKLSLLTFLSYIFFFPSFFSGPINRYNSYSESITAEPDVPANLLSGGKRVISGLFKKVVLGDSFFPYSIAALDLNTATPIEIVLGVYAYMFFVYFNFSGYTDMAIGCGKLVGIELPENFNYPFFKRNLQQFWANWHMSLTTWLTDYIYWPLAKKLRKTQKLRKRPVTNSNICIIVTFLVCGVWHGDGINFIIWGAYHGIGLAILNGYSHILKTYGTKEFKTFVHKSPIAYAISNIITIQYVSFGFLIFACNLAMLNEVFRVLF